MNTKVNMNKATDLVKFVIRNVEKEGLDKATRMVKSDNNESIDMNKIVIPIITNDESVRGFIDEFELNKPLNMIKFFVESYYANIECISEGIATNLKTDFINSISNIKSAKKKFNRALSNRDDKSKFESAIYAAQNSLDDGITQLEEKIFGVYIPEIQKIDNRGKFEFFLKAKASMAQIDINTELARESVKTIVSAVQLHMAVASVCHCDIDDSVIKPFESFKNKLISNNNCSLMYDYDNEKERAFWKKIENEIDVICNDSDDVCDSIKSFIDEIIIV